MLQPTDFHRLHYYSVGQPLFIGLYKAWNTQCDFNLVLLSITASAVANGKNVGFIGLGNMGSHMAANLMKGGHNVTVFDIVKSQVDAVVAEGKLLIKIQQF